MLIMNFFFKGRVEMKTFSSTNVVHVPSLLKIINFVKWGKSHNIHTKKAGNVHYALLAQCF